MARFPRPRSAGLRRRRGPGRAAASSVHAVALSLLLLLCAADARGQAKPADAEEALALAANLSGEVDRLVRQGQPLTALDALAPALEWDALRRDWRAYFLSTACTLALHGGRPQRAIDFSERAEAEIDPTDLATGPFLAAARGVRSRAYLAWGLRDLAERASDDQWKLIQALRHGAEDWVQSTGRQWHAAAEVRADVLLSGRPAEAVRWIDMIGADPIYHDPKLDDPKSWHAQLQRRLGLALVDLELDDPRRPARAESVLGAVLAGALLEPHDLVRSAVALAELHVQRQRFDAARAALDQATQLLDAAGSRAAAADRRYAHIVATRRAIDSGAPRTALEHWQAQLTDDFETVANEERELRPGGFGPLHFTDPRALLNVLIRLDGALLGESRAAQLALDRMARIQASGSLASSLPESNGRPAPGTWTRLLPRSDGLGLAYLPGPVRSHLVAWDHDGFAVHELASRDVLNEARQLVVDDLRNPARTEAGSASARDHLEQLAARLLPERFEERLAAHHELVIVGRELLDEPPFEALPFRGRPLGSSHALVELPSLPWAARAVARPTRADLRGLLIAAPELHASLGLADVRLDHGAARELLDGYEWAEVVFGERATLESILDADLGSVDVLQLFTHGVQLAKLERPAALALTPTARADGMLHAAVIDSLHAAPAVVMLTACRSGRSPTRFGDAGAAGLAGAWLRRGARAVVVSSYDLDEETARQFSVEFHRGLAEGVSPAEAARRARARLADDPRFAGAVHHGTLRVVGLGHEAIRAPRPWWTRAAAWLGIALGIALVMLAARRRRSTTRAA